MRDGADEVLVVNILKDVEFREYMRNGSFAVGGEVRIEHCPGGNNHCTAGATPDIFMLGAKEKLSVKAYP